MDTYLDALCGPLDDSDGHGKRPLQRELKSISERSTNALITAFNAWRLTGALPPAWLSTSL